MVNQMDYLKGLPILTKVCNRMTMTTKEKRSANTDIEIYLSILLLHLIAYYLSHFGWQGKVTKGATFICYVSNFI